MIRLLVLLIVSVFAFAAPADAKGPKGSRPECPCWEDGVAGLTSLISGGDIKSCDRHPVRVSAVPSDPTSIARLRVEGAVEATIMAILRPRQALFGGRCHVVDGPFFDGLRPQVTAICIEDMTAVCRAASN